MDIAGAYLTATQWQKLVREERASGPTFDRPLRRRLWLYRRGFLSKSDVVYELESNDHREYLSDYARYIGTKRINGTWAYQLDNKLAFHQLLGEFPAHRPAVHGLIQNGRVHEFDVGGTGSRAGTGKVASDGGVQFAESTASGARGTRHVVDWLDDHLRDGDVETVVLKWFSGGGGQNVHICSYDEDAGSYVLDGRHVDRPAFAATVTDLEEYMICEFVEQAPYAAAVYPETTNTIRALTMFDERADEAFVPIAVHRFGSSSSRPVDNFSDGGFSVEIDRETGELGRAAGYPDDGTVSWHERHPETKTQIEGTAVPGWPAIRNRLCELATTFSHLPYVGWDLVVTDEGEFEIIEANSYPGMVSLQVHRPLLADDRVRRFYRRHGVL
ncbi:sugar-transfer associated ATP-grasp domain-containing protein [Natrononativus amylolyticus]|uniref:sugar-transfer associated ATP-grasp domain-containing protein n=1 Tax=Natrononativus amylolyticus TaxID=2963434 RepID=UPI0020CFAADC|nr:sugar-transfer associated ATP-grasp domain-containing protein [Natrononativus amylolyticus]